MIFFFFTPAFISGKKIYKKNNEKTLDTSLFYNRCHCTILSTYVKKIIKSILKLYKKYVNYVECENNNIL